MNSFVAFLVKYWQFISTLLVIIITILLSIFKKTKFKISLPSNTLSQLIDLVKSAEDIYGSGHGANKLNYVVETFMKNNDIKYFGSEVRYYLTDLVERILSTPQRKEVK